MKGRSALTNSAEHGAQPAGDHTPDDDRILSIEIGGKTIGENLEAAIAAGDVIRRPDGKLELPELPTTQLYIGKPGEFGRPCRFLKQFMFTHIYGSKAVPIGCRDCYKVRVIPETLRQLMAVKTISESFSCSAKSGAEADNQDNQSLYGTYFYLLGLDKARAVYRRLRGMIDADPKLGAKVKMVIKRGCTEYERACGPSNRYTFDPRLADVEKYFWSRFVKEERERNFEKENAKTMLEMIRTAYRIGDDTYKDFTGGQDLLPPTVTYDPDGPSIEGDPE
jgi:hypothetical protein